jgi:hypothetical protein
MLLWLSSTIECVVSEELGLKIGSLNPVQSESEARSGWKVVFNNIHFTYTYTYSCMI